MDDTMSLAKGCEPSAAVNGCTLRSDRSALYSPSPKSPNHIRLSLPRLHLLVGRDVYVSVVAGYNIYRIGNEGTSGSLGVEMVERVGHRIIYPHTNVGAHPDVAVGILVERCNEVALQAMLVVVGTINLEGCAVEAV